MSITLIEQYPQNKKSSIAIRPYFEDRKQNMGLEKYGLTLFDGAFHEEPLVCLTQNGISRYVTGLNEFAPEVKLLSDELKEAKIKEIRTIVSQLEKELAANVVDVKSKNFWNEVKLLRPDNIEFWEGIKIRCSNDPVYLDPVKDPYDLLKIYAIEAGGFSIVAPNLERARKMQVPPKFFLDKIEQTVSTRTEVKKLRAKALSILQDLYDTNPSKLLYVAKVVDINSTQYKKNTPNDILFDNMDMYITGESVEKDKRKSAKTFMDIADLDMETLKLRAIVKDATFYKYIMTKSDGQVYHIETGNAMGRNPSEVVGFLKNPLNEDILRSIQDKVEKLWNA